MDHVQKYISSTKLSQVLSSILYGLRPAHASHTTQTKDNKTKAIVQQLPHHVDTQDYYVQIENLQKIYTDQIGRFPVSSSTGSKFCFVLYSFDAHAILVEHIKNRSASELLRAHKNWSNT